MKGLRTGASLMIMLVISLIVSIAGCAQPSATGTPTPTTQPTPSPQPTQAISPSPVPGSNEAHIDFYYNLKTYSTPYEGIAPLPGEVIYAIDVTVNSDQPIHTDDSWFHIEYRRNATAPLQDLEPNSVFEYPSTTIGGGAAPAKGRLLIALPAPENGNQVRPYYFKPLDQQTGDYKVKAPAYGVLRTT